ncbi:hypothetical protein CASFOL_035397 [Castilleja foliolosa]|uniref:FBD domain-containing protein n=1 Tax=Castilleja foliolosa TaxID=1961234 RepID=A0ABD3BUV4_9LAMI
MTSPHKRIKETPIDRLSALPDCLIIHILSLLEVKQSAITALLSKRWQFLWTESPRLIFKEKRISTWALKRFVSRVNRTLVVCGRNDLDTFELDFPYSKIYCPDYNVWVGFAVKSKAKQVSLSINHILDDFYTLPRTIFQSAYVKQLTLRGCTVAPRATIEWPSLTKLHIEDAELQQHVIEKILSGCPVLHCLVLKHCRGFNRLDMCSKSLYELWVDDSVYFDDFDKHYEDFDKPLLQISAPNLHTLSVSVNPKGRKLCLGNISSLVRATINFAVYVCDTSSTEVMSNAMEILEKIRHVKVVDLRYGYIKVLSRLAMNDRFPQSARTCLWVNAPTDKCSMHVVIGLLESSPNLEALVIDFSSIVRGPCTYLDSKTDLDCDLLHLKRIVIKDFTSPNCVGEPMLTLARILLNKAPALEKMVVRIESFTSSPQAAVNEDEPFNIAQALLSYPRSSKAVVVFN